MTSKKQSSSDSYAFAEVIESNLNNFLAQSWQWDLFPKFGSLVHVENENKIIFGCVIQIQTGSMDPIRYPFAYKKTEEELLKEQPQIFELLKTTFKVQVLGYQEKEKIFYSIPQKPCKIHSFVKKTNSELNINFFNNSDFLRILFGFSDQISYIDELLVAILKNINDEKKISNKQLMDFCQTLSILTGNDYRRIKLFLRRIESL